MSKGFFTADQTTVKVDIAKKATGCGACGLYKHCLSPKMDTAGKGRKGILLVLEAPGGREDRVGKPLVGRSRRTVTRVLERMGLDLDLDLWRTNANICRPEKNKTPTDQQIAYCRPRLFKEIKRLKPRGIIVMGLPALKSVIQHRWIGDKMGVNAIKRWRGFTIPDQDLGCWLCPTWHPAYVNRSEKDPSVQLLFEMDLENAVRTILETPFPKYGDEAKRIRQIMNPNLLDQELERIHLQSPFFVFDWETTGIRPYAKGHRIVSCSICTPDLDVIAFPMPRHKSRRVHLRRLLSDWSVGKGAHNMGFEHLWAGHDLKTIVQGWQWDSQLAAHIIDNRSYITSLKFQTYVNFGVIDYDSHMGTWLHSSPQDVKKYGANAKNKIFKLVQEKDGWNTLLTYNGLDSIYEMMLARKQMELIGVDHFASTNSASI